MTIQEAIKSGKRFRSLTGNHWFGPHLPEYTFKIEEFLANDWEVEDSKFEVTEQVELTIGYEEGEDK